MRKAPRQLPWLEPGEPFPALTRAWGPADPAPGLLAAGGALDVPTLLDAYSQCIFPWFSPGQPILWWSTDPRMVLVPERFRLHCSLRKTLVNFVSSSAAEIRIDTAFRQVMENCSRQPRPGQSGTWIVPEMVEAYVALHEAGHAHSVETWVDGQLVAGLYTVAIGRAVFGESMYTHVTDGSKIALAALVALCRRHGVTFIDCQQNTPHLASLGGEEIGRTEFAAHVAAARREPTLKWHFDPLYWRELLPERLPKA